MAVPPGSERATNVRYVVLAFLCTLALLLYLGRHLQDAPVLILATYRLADGAGQQALELTLGELIRERLAEEVDLSALQVTGTAALIQARLPDRAVSDQLIELVHARAQGNPFYIEELLNYLPHKQANALARTTMIEVERTPFEGRSEALSRRQSVLETRYPGISLAMVSRPEWMLWPAFIDRLNRSMASGRFSSNLCRRRSRSLMM